MTKRLWFSETVQDEVQPIIYHSQYRHARRTALIHPKGAIGGSLSVGGLVYMPKYECAAEI